MPCDSVRTVTIDTKLFQLDRLTEALQSLGHKEAYRQGDRVYFDSGYYERSQNSGQFTFNSSYGAFDQGKLNMITAEVACKYVESEARKNGFLWEFGKKTAAVINKVVGW